MDKYLENYPPVLRICDVSEILGVTDASVRKLIKENKLTAVKVGRVFRIPKSKLLDFMCEA